MGNKLAIKGHATRGKEVIKLLEMMGGCSPLETHGLYENRFYFIGDNGWIKWDYIGPEEIDEYKIFTLEEFLEKYPFKVGDKVFLYDNITEGCVTGMKWDADKGTIKYCVYTSAECWCDVKELLEWNAIDLVEKHYEKQCDEMNEIETKRDMDKTMFMLTHILLPETPHNVNDKLEYKIIDGYKFDRVENDKIILKLIKPKYPITYDECCDMLNANEFVRYELMTNFPKLINARNVYWKIAGEEMGLDKPWEPDWDNLSTNHEFIKIDKGCFTYSSRLLVFPTEKMRDTFYENFKDLIEQCKELL